MMHRLQTRRALSSAALLLAFGIAGCGGDPAVTPPPQQDPTTMFWQLTLDVHAATMSTVAPYDTLRITATPRTISGSAITDLPAPTYQSMDLDRALVDSSGLVHVVGAGDQIVVVASLEVDNILHADTLFLNVTEEASPPTLTTFTIHPAAGDSAKTGAGISAFLAPRALDANGDMISDVAVYFASSDPTTATIDRASGSVSGGHPGTVTLYATTTTYGVTKTDTLPFQIGYPVFLQLYVVPQVTSGGQTIGTYTPNKVTVGAGALIFFLNTTAPATDITFDDPTNVGADVRDCSPDFPPACESGNIGLFGPDPSDETGLSGVRIRAFPVPGTYNYHSTLFGSTGTIIVADEHTH